jgi:hypothetical protein
MSYIPKYIIKRIVPSDALFNIDLNGDGKVEGTAVKYVNVVTPLMIPADTDVEAIKKEFVGAWIDNEKYPLEKLMLIYEGKKYTLDNVKNILGLTVPIGGILYIVALKSGGSTVGMHKVKIVTQYKDQKNENEVERELTADRKCVKFP